MVPLDEAEFDRWRGQAARALRTATLAADGGEHGWACFMAEQAVQLGVKGLLHGVGTAAWGHDLVTLEATVAAELGDAWSGQLADAAARLSRHYIATRYPDAHASGEPGDHYRPSDAAQALTDARAVLAAIDTAWARLGADPEEAGA